MRPKFVSWTLGKSVQSRELQATAVAPAESHLPAQPGCAELPWILCLGAVHGDEIEGVWLIEEIRAQWMREYPFQKVGVVLLPQANPDGVAMKQRWNARNVDLNRNLPTQDWTSEVKNPRYPPGLAPASEPENQALIALIEACRPIAILSAHSFSDFQVNSNGPARPWAESLAAVCGYPVTEDIGYPTPGSLGTYAGVERKIPTITLEIERGIFRDQVLKLHLPVVHAALKYWEDRQP